MPEVYEHEQDRMDREYRMAFANPTHKRFLGRMERAGLKPEAQVDGIAYGVVELNEGASTVSYMPPEPPETIFDRMVEKYGLQHGKMIEEIMEEVRKPMEDEMEQRKASAIKRVAGWLIKAEKGNLLARIHSLIHAIPLLGKAMGYSSMRESARACGATVTWIKNSRDKWCVLLDIPVPIEGQKKPESKAKYKKAAKEKHWRNRRYQIPS